MKAIQRTLKFDCGPPLEFEKVGSELVSAKVDYGGIEIGRCEKLTLEQILPALPPLGRGGSVQLIEHVSEGTKRILEAPEKLLKGSFDHPRPKVPGSVHFGGGEKRKVCDKLIRRGICQWIKSSEVVSVEGT